MSGYPCGYKQDMSCCSVVLYARGDAFLAAAGKEVDLSLLVLPKVCSSSAF